MIVTVGPVNEYGPSRVLRVKFPLDVCWYSTHPNPRAQAYGPDQGQRGWRLHAVIHSGKGQVPTIRAVCGLRPSHGWGIDPFIEKPCAKCIAKLDAIGADITVDYTP